MLLVKVRNALGLMWDSFDDAERKLVLYGAAWLLLILVAGAQRRSKERLRREIVEELADAAPRRP